MQCGSALFILSLLVTIFNSQAASHKEAKSTPKTYKLAILNNEMSGPQDPCYFTKNCRLKNLSCRFLSHIKDQSLVKQNYVDIRSAIDAVYAGDALGALYISENYTDAYVARIILGDDADEETISNSQIIVWLSKENNGLDLNKVIKSSYKEFVEDLTTTCGFDKDKFRVLSFETDPEFADSTLVKAPLIVFNYA